MMDSRGGDVSPAAGEALTLVDDHLLQLPLGRGSLQDLLVNGVGGDQAVDHHRFGLSDAVAAVLSLQVGLRVLRGQRTFVDVSSSLVTSTSARPR